MAGYFNFVPYNDRPKCFLDIEGTGVDLNRHEVIEVGMVHDVYGDYCCRIRPRHWDRAQREALIVSKYNPEDWKDAPFFSEVAPQIIKWLKGSWVIGHNLIGYDMPLMKAEFSRAGFDDEDIFKDVGDTMMMARSFLVPGGHLKRIGLKPLCKFLGMEYSEHAHNALDDAQMTKEVFERLQKSIQYTNGKPFQTSIFG